MTSLPLKEIGHLSDTEQPQHRGVIRLIPQVTQLAIVEQQMYH
jgi:hypothetical protein